MNVRGIPKIPIRLLPLWRAMSAGRKIKKIVCSAGDNNHIIENFLAVEFKAYKIFPNRSNLVETDLSETYMDTSSGHDFLRSRAKSFYMQDIESFELFPYIELPDGKEVELKDLNELFAS